MSAEPKASPRVIAALLAAGVASCTASEVAQHAAWNAPGFSAVDPDQVESEDYARHFPDQGSVFHPDADLAGPVRALLLVALREGVLPHARYRVSWHIAADGKSPDRQLHYVEVQRFNLGPARREDLGMSVPAEHLADVSEFGTGADVAWRFTMAARQGMRAGVVHAARRELTAAESLAADCLGTPCAALAEPPMPGGKWFERDVTAPSIAYPPASEGPHPARVAEDLVAALGEEADQPLPFDARTPRFVFVISANVGGQDLATTALARDAMVLDDDTGTIWARWREASDAAPESALLYQSRDR